MHYKQPNGAMLVLLPILLVGGLIFLANYANPFSEPLPRPTPMPTVGCYDACKAAIEDSKAPIVKPVDESLDFEEEYSGPEAFECPYGKPVALDSAWKMLPDGVAFMPIYIGGTESVPLHLKWIDWTKCYRFNRSFWRQFSVRDITLIALRDQYGDLVEGK